MWRSFLYWLSGKLPCRLINDGTRPYLERYYLFTVLGVRFYLHRFVGDDPDRGLHDHPWAWAKSLLLAGTYKEERRDGTHHVRWWNALVGDNFHRVVLFKRATGYIERVDGQSRFALETIEVWTIFFHKAGDVKPWGFLKPLSGETADLVFTPHNYRREGSQARWWITAPKGRLTKRRSLHRTLEISGT